jgi:hypothetical protein
MRTHKAKQKACKTIQQCITAETDLSATETALNKSSIVATNVFNPISHVIRVNTRLPRLLVSTNKPCGTLKLSGDTALATASASLIAL